MGVSIEQYRMKIGTFIQKGSRRKSNIPYSPAFSCLQLFGEVYQWAIIPRGIIASAANFTFYQKKLIDPNPAQFTL